MIKNVCVCDKCGKEITCPLVAFRIVCVRKDNRCNISDEKKSEFKEFCPSCFNDMLDEIGIQELKNME